MTYGFASAVGAESLMRRHPGVLLEWTEARLGAAGPEERERIWDQVGFAVLKGDPPAVLDLLERCAPRTRLGR